MPVREVEFDCDECGHALVGTMRIGVTIDVEPCPICRKAERLDAHKAGFGEGYEACFQEKDPKRQ